MHNRTPPGIPSGVVPHHAEAPHSIKVEAEKLEIAEREMLVLVALTRRLLVAQGGGKRGGKEPVAGKHPIVGVASGNGIVGVFHAVELQFIVKGEVLVFEPLTEHILQFLMVELERLVGIADAQQRRTATALLTCALTESGWIGEALVVEDVVEIEAFNAHVETRKRQAVQGVPGVVVVECDALDVIVVTRLPPEEVDANGGTVEAQVKLLLGGLVVSVMQGSEVYRIAQEEPTPTEIRAELDTDVGREDDFLSVLAAEGIHLVGGGLLEHQRVVIVLWLDVGRVHRIERLDHTVESPSDASPEAPFPGLGRNGQSVCRQLSVSHIHTQRICCQHPGGVAGQEDKERYQNSFYHVCVVVNDQNLPKMRSITQLTGVADTAVQSQSPMPWRLSMTERMMGSCT